MLEHWIEYRLDYALLMTLVLGILAAVHLHLRRQYGRTGVPFWGCLLTVLILLAGFLLTERVDQNEREEMRLALQGFGHTFRGELERLGHARLGLGASPRDPLYLELIEAEVRWLTSNPCIGDIYTLRRRPDGGIVILVDSETDYDRNGTFEGDLEARTPLGEEYPQAGPSIEAALAGRVVINEKFHTDRWGTWVSGYFPLRDPEGRVEAVLGVDYPARYWLNRVLSHRMAVMGCTALFALVLVTSSSLIALLRAEVCERRRAECELAVHRRELEEQVQARSAALLEAGRQVMQSEKLASLGQLAAGVAHEINTPIQYVGDNLRAISDFLGDLVCLTDQYRDILERLSPDGELKELIGRIREAERSCDLEFIREDAPKAVAQGLDGVQRVAHIVRAMKDFSHVDRGQIGRVDVNRAMENTLTVARNEYKYVADVHTAYGDLPAIEAYGGELNQVFLNLLVNAAHAIEETGSRGVITIRTAHQGDHVEVAISDTGSGIPPEIQSRMFDPFFTTKPVGKGTGQGLNIAHQIVVRQHGGAIRFETQAGRGTTFWIRLPVTRARPPGAQESGSREVQSSPEESSSIAAG